MVRFEDMKYDDVVLVPDGEEPEEKRPEDFLGRVWWFLVR